MADDAPYRCVKVTVWHDEKFIALSDDAQAVWFHVYTNPLTNGLGLYHATIEGLAANRRWDLKRYRKGFGECLRERLFIYDETYQVIYFPRFIRHNRPANPNVMQNLLKIWAALPATPLKHSLYAELKGLGEPFAERLETLGLTLPVTIPETETETETETEVLEKPNGFSACSELCSSKPADPPDDPVPIAISFPTNRHETTGEVYDVPEARVADYSQLYPAVDVTQELRNMLGWLMGNPTKRKTLGGMPRFITGWLAKEQNRGGHHGRPAAGGAASRPTTADTIRENLARLEGAPDPHAQAVAGDGGNVRSPLDDGDGGGADGDLVGSVRRAH